MANIRIKVTTDELRQAISKFNTCRQEMTQAYSQMAMEAMSLNSSWNGEASRTFMDQFSEMINNIRTSEPTIEQAVKGLEVAAREYRIAEGENITDGNNMKEGSPFNA